jgi:hypothetical protein
LIKDFGTGLPKKQQSQVACQKGGVSGPGTIAIERVGEENARAEQTQYRRHYLDHRNIPSRPAQERTTAALHSQKDSGTRTEIEGGLRYCCNTCPEAGR